MRAFASCLAFLSGLLSAPAATPKPAGGKASWYGEGYRGKTMANGQPFNPDALTCAAWDWPLGTVLSVRYRHANGYVRSVVVTVTDRGPDKRLGRVLDLSRAAFFYLTGGTKLGVVEVGIVQVGGDE